MTLSPDFVTGALGFLFTILIFSYAFGDNPLFRVGVYLFTGVSAGYIGAVAFWQVLYPRLILPLIGGDVILLIPLLLAFLILMKISPRLAGLSSLAMAFMVGVGAAVTIAGAVSGTLIPQVSGAINAFATQTSPAPAESLFNAALILVGAISTLAYFHFGAKPGKKDGIPRRAAPVEWLAWLGRVFIGITLGAIFAGLFSAALTALLARLYFLITFVNALLASFGISL